MAGGFDSHDLSKRCCKRNYKEQADCSVINDCPNSFFLKPATLLQVFLVKSKGGIMFATLMQIKPTAYAF